MFKYTKHSLKKTETLFEELGYVIRYEKGNFNSGYCVVESQKIAVINKFYDTEGRINCLLDILSGIEVETEQLTEKTAKWFKTISKTFSQEATAEETEPEKESE